MSEDQFYVAGAKGKGRGVFSDGEYREGEFLFSSELIILTEEDTKIIENTSLKHYVYFFDEKRDCIALGNGSLLNHSDTPNVTYEVQKHPSSRPYLMFNALRSIGKDEELTIDYRKDYPVNLDEALNNEVVLK